MFRKATIDDCKDVYNLICDMENTILPMDHFSEIFRRQMCDEAYYCLLCEQDGITIGMLNLRFENQLHHATRIAEIMEFAVDRGFRNRGIGREMLAKACDIAKDNNCVQIEVACNQLRRDTHRFYEREGMKNYHYKYSKSLTEIQKSENKIGR